MLRTWTLVVSAGLVTLGCAPGQFGDRFHAGKPGQHKCQSSNACDVGVGVYCPPDTTKHCLITVDLSVVEIEPRNANNNKVTWKIDEETKADWKFANDAITINSTFTCTPGNFVSNCIAKSDTPPDLYKYTIKVEPRSGTRMADPLDPWVVTN
jgi:hypothetical protein